MSVVQDADVAPRLRSVVSRPTAQQLLGALVKAMRLRELLDTRIGVTTRKAFERGDRVKPQARTEYVYALAAILVELGFPRPLGDDDSITSDEMVTLVAESRIATEILGCSSPS